MGSEMCIRDSNNTYILVKLSESGTKRWEVQVFTKTEMCKKFPVRGSLYAGCLTVSHDRVFVAAGSEIDVYDLNGISVGKFGKGTLQLVRDIAAGPDDQIFVLDLNDNDEKIAYVFTEDGHQHNNFRVDSKEDDYFGLAIYSSGEYVVFSGLELKARRLKVALYRKDGVLNRSVTLGERLSKDAMPHYKNVLGLSGIAVTNDGRVAVLFHGKVIVRPMKPC